MLDIFSLHINQILDGYKQKVIGIAISGGVDSVVLAHLLRELNFNIALIHVNFKLRDAESDGDHEFLKNLSRQWKVELYSKKVDTSSYASQQKMSTQMAARKLRYDYFNELIEDRKVDCVVTAHHLDDQLETFLINLGRGSGLKGLSGIPFKNGMVLRPLLPFTREQILTYAQENQILWREDSSNSSNKYARNALRNRVIPMLKNELPQIMGHLYDSLHHMKDAQSFIDIEMSRFRESGIKNSPHLFEIEIYKLLDTKKPKFYLFELLRDTQINSKEAYKLLSADSGKQILSETHHLIKDRSRLILKLRSTPNKINLKIESADQIEQVNGLTLRMKFMETADTNKFIKNHQGKNVLLLDASSVEFPMLLRNWKKGDKINPLGMQGNQKVSDILINHKISIADKENFLVLENKGAILWLVGLKSSNLYKITFRSKRILKIWLD